VERVEFLADEKRKSNAAAPPVCSLLQEVPVECGGIVPEAHQFIGYPNEVNRELQGPNTMWERLEPIDGFSEQTNVPSLTRSTSERWRGVWGLR
jgi:hypothetical protein